MLLLVSVVRCVKVIFSAERPEKTGYFTFKNFSLRSHKEFTLCARFQSYKFGLTDENYYQNIIYQGDKSLLGVVTNQYCDHLAAGCTKNQKENNSNDYWEHGKSYGYHQYLGDWEYFEIWKPTIWNMVCILASTPQRFYQIFINGETIQDYRYTKNISRENNQTMQCSHD